MTITAKIITYSMNPQEIPLITFELEGPRFIHAEFMTHRMFSRNASSSRAIPVMRMIQMVRQNPAMPIHWGKNQPGMQAREELDLDLKAEAYSMWRGALHHALAHAEEMAKIGIHKQIVNRILEPFMHIKVVVTATDYKNFFALRDHEDAQPEIRELAKQMKLALEGAMPNQLKPGDWHLPYITAKDWSIAYNRVKYGRITRDEPHQNELLYVLRKASVARCARVSYMNHDGSDPDLTKDIELHDKLVVATPLHASPAEHQATPDDWNMNMQNGELSWVNPHQHGNLRGWCQYRKMLPNEYMPG